MYLEGNRDPQRQFAQKRCETPGQLQGSKTSLKLEKKTRKLPPGPRPQIPGKNSQKILVFEYHSYFLSCFQGIWGRDLGGNFRVSLSRGFGVRGFGTCSWPGVSQQKRCANILVFSRIPSLSDKKCVCHRPRPRI